ncbi:FAD binding domain-containing protein [Arthrobacter monumenti]
MDMSTVVATEKSHDPDQWQPGDAWLAGGTVLYSYGTSTLKRLLDISYADWPALTVTDEGLEIAATCTIAELYAFPRSGQAPVDRWPALSLFRQCCDSFVASFKIWNMSTVGGNIATSLPAGPMTSLTAALDGVATILVPGGGSRELPVAGLVTGDAQNALEPGELIRSIHLPAAALSEPVAFRRLSLSNLGRSGVLLIGRKQNDGGIRLTITASTKRPVQLDLLPGASAADLAAAIDEAVPTGLYHDDIHGLPAWRRDMTYLLAEQIRAELGEGPTS